jgi:uncharacterized protein (DUF58 family)
MHWKVRARTRRPQVRVYREERDRPALLVVDQRQSMFFGSRRAMKSVVAAEAAALAAWRVLHVGDRVGALVFDDREIVELPPRRSRAQVVHILEAVVAKNHALRVAPDRHAEPGMLNRALGQAARLAAHDALVCLITDGAGTDAETTRRVTQLAAHNDVLIALVHDPLESALPAAGRLVMSEGDRQLEVDTSPEGLRQRYANDYADRLAHASQLARQRRIPVLPLDTADDVAIQLRRLLGQRLAAGR